MTAPARLSDSLEDFNTRGWATGRYVEDYSGTHVEAAEAALLARHADALRGRTLELGCGAGRLTRVLVALSQDVEALDVSPLMVEACRRNVPRALVTQGDLRGVAERPSASVDAVVASNNLLDVLGDETRRRVLVDIARILSPGGAFLLSTHNRAHVVQIATTGDGRAATRSPSDLARTVKRARHAPTRIRNQRRARSFERSEADYQVVNDLAHAYRFAHYYIDRDAQERQFAAVSLALVDCLDRDGAGVPAGAKAAMSPSLHYAARRVV